MTQEGATLQRKLSLFQLIREGKDGLLVLGEMTSQSVIYQMTKNITKRRNQITLLQLSVL